MHSRVATFNDNELVNMKLPLSMGHRICVAMKSRSPVPVLHIKQQRVNESPAHHWLIVFI